MTARPVDPECRRRPVYAAVALVLVMVAVLLAAGSIQPAVPDTSVTTIPSTIPTIQLSDMKLAKQIIADAEIEINKADEVIAWFKSNASTRNDPHLPAIMTKREVAASYLIRAKDEIAAGDYRQARIHAEDAYNKANESYKDAFYYQECPVLPCNCPKVSFSLDRIIPLLIICGISALLTALLHSLMKTISLPLVTKVHQHIDRVPVYSVFVISWIVFSIVTLSGFFAVSQSANKIAWYIYLILGGLLMAVMIPAIMVTVLVIVRSIYYLTNRGTSIFTYDDTTMLTHQERKKCLISFLLLVILIILMPLVIFIGMLLSLPPRCL